MRVTFFRNAAALDVPDLFKEIAVKLVCYTIAMIPDYSFNRCINGVVYRVDIGSLLSGNEKLNAWVVQRFVESIAGSETLTDGFKNAFFQIITDLGYVRGTMDEIRTGNRYKAILLFNFVKMFYHGDKYDEFYDIYCKE